MRYRRIIPIVIVSILSFSYACTKAGDKKGELDESAPLLLSLDTKALGPGDRTYCASIFYFSTLNYHNYGTYCSESIDHSGTTGTWLAPCRVDNDGNPLKPNGTAAASLAEADHDGKWGLHGLGASYYLTIHSPAKKRIDGSNGCLDITESTQLYISDPVAVSLLGDFLDGQFVYSALTSTPLKLRERSARLFIHIECGEQPEANIQQINITNRPYSARYNLYSGYLASNYSTDTVPVFNYETDNAGTILHLDKSLGESWTSASGVYLPSVDFSQVSYAGMRPVIQVLMGDNPSSPLRAYVEIKENVEPMKNYTYNLYVSKSQVVVYLTAEPWDNGGTHASDDSEAPSIIGTFSVDGWSVNSGDTATAGWNDHF